MTKKHFIALADCLRETQPAHTDAECGTHQHAYEWLQWKADVTAIVGFCRRQNSNFNESTFRGYIAGTCGPSGGKVKHGK